MSRPRPQHTVNEVVGPWIGSRDSTDPQTKHPKLARLLTNVVPTVPQIGGAVVGRPGFQLTEDNQLGAGSDRSCQRFFHWTKLDGTEYTMGFCGGKMYTYNWSTRAWTNVALSGVSLDTTAIVYCAVFNDTLLVNPNDGTNKCWTWDGTTFTSLTNSSTIFGQPVVYYSRWFGISWAERSTLIWSEVNAANTGFEAGGYNNAWTLGQTDQHPLYALAATDEALYYFRRHSIGAIYGSVESDFTTTAVREAISTSVGTISPGAVVLAGRRVFFLNDNGYPYYFAVGGSQAVPIWHDCVETIKDLPRTELPSAEAVHYLPNSLVLFGLAETGQTTLSMALSFYDDGVTAPQYAGRWSGFNFNSLDVGHDDSDREVVVIGAPGTSGSAAGYFYDFGYPETGTIWTDGFKAGAEAIRHEVGFVVGGDVRWPVRWDTVDLSFRMYTDLSAMSVVVSGSSDNTYTSSPVTRTGSVALWDVAQWDVDSWSTFGEERHVEVGIDGEERWLYVRVQHDTSGERFGLNRAMVNGFIQPPHALTP